MKVGLSTTVVLRLLVGQPADQAQRAVAFLDELSRRGDQPVVGDLVVAEVYLALQYHHGVSKKDALAEERSWLSRLWEAVKPNGWGDGSMGSRAPLWPCCWGGSFLWVFTESCG